MLLGVEGLKYPEGDSAVEFNLEVTEGTKILLKDLGWGLSQGFCVALTALP